MRSRGQAWRSAGALAGTAAALAGFLTLSRPAQAQFASDKVELLSWLSPDAFGTGAVSGNDCWGYVSPSGREYAIAGLSNTMAFVDITDPANPVIVENILHPDSLWGAIKVHGEYAYAGNETGGGIQVIDMTRIDEGIVELVTTVLPNETHTLAINPDSGYLYTCGAHNICSGLIALDLTDPRLPVDAGRFYGYYVHEAQIVSFHEGPYAGREIAYCCAAGDGLVIVDVTDKARMREIGRTTYPGLAYCHQGWLSADRRFFYVNDELDELNGHTNVTKTHIFDVSDPREPTYVGWFSNGLGCTDHNLYVRDQFVYESNYTTGLRVFDAADPLEPVEVGWFDTFPAHDRVGFSGAWSNFCFFPSGNVVICDIDRGMFVVDPSEALTTRRLVLDEPILVAGEIATLRASNVPAGEAVRFYFSLRGEGGQYVADLNVMLLLAKPGLVGETTADGAGVATLQKRVPPAGRGLNVSLQAAAPGRISNVATATIE